MSNLSKSIYDYYFKHLDKLPTDAQFHLGTRLHFWDQDPQAQDLLNKLTDWFTGDGDHQASLQTVYDEAQNAPLAKVNNARELRRPFFEKYPLLRTCNLLLFRITFLKHVYGIDVRDQFYAFCPREQVEAMRTALLEDDEALRVLATYATNFLYLYDRVIAEDESSLPIDKLYEVGKDAYDLSDRMGLQLYIYLYTHCIIGESLFYYRALPASNRATYQAMVADLERVIDEHYDDINLDNKFEFLVAAKIADYQTSLEQRIFAEAERSVSPDGTFLIDTINNFPQPDKRTLDGSEHRNVLFILANRDFKPLQPE
ncbi:MAG: Alpha-L-glutamate ligase, RimK family [Candidatus Saccharibacteria bacterium]|nr:Alpha-L-glutamate ligase, RimK family [Candidatus Saccharibacteria bacterium]